MKVLFCGGGTGGHITPALGMADIIRQNYKEAQFAFVGRQGGRENEAITREGYKLYTLKVSGFKRSLSVRNLLAAVEAIKAVSDARKLIREFSPDIIIGTGGYVSYPVLRAGIRAGITTMIHESNAYPGLVTRMLGHKCDKVLLNYDKAAEHLPKAKNTVTIGNPVRSKLKSMTRETARSTLGIKSTDFLIVSFGGSLGARKINDVVCDVMEHYSAVRNGTVHIHASGRDDYERMLSLHPEMKGRCKIVPYIHDMPTYLKACDIAITRSGAMTLSELAASGVPAILIPSPNVTANHQYENAKVLSDAGAALMLEETELTSLTLIEMIKRLRADRNERYRMGKEIKKFDADPAPTLISVIKSALAGK